MRRVQFARGAFSGRPCIGRSQPASAFDPSRAEPGGHKRTGKIEKFVIRQRTRRHRADKQQPLTIEESDRAVRLLRVQSLAEQTFGDPDKAGRWLRRPLAEPGGETPLAIAQTEAGGRVIEIILGKIAWGAAA